VESGKVWYFIFNGFDVPIMFPIYFSHAINNCNVVLNMFFKFPMCSPTMFSISHNWSHTFKPKQIVPFNVKSFLRYLLIINTTSRNRKEICLKLIDITNNKCYWQLVPQFFMKSHVFLYLSTMIEATTSMNHVSMTSTKVIIANHFLQNYYQGSQTLMKTINGKSCNSIDGGKILYSLSLFETCWKLPIRGFTPIPSTFINNFKLFIIY
jgi:hypothetical protein